MRRIATSVLLLIASAHAQAAATNLDKAYETKWAPRLVPMLTEVIRFPTIAGNTQAFIDQKAWLARVADEFGFTVRDKGKVTEVELAGPAGAPVLGLAVHGDVQPVDDHWSIPPFAGVEKNGMVLGRGSADDKGPLVQALLAMKTLAASGKRRTHTIRLLVGSDEESGSTDMKEYVKSNAAPDYTLVLDSNFPVVVGERAWNALTVETLLSDREASAGKVTSLVGGLAASIVPDSVVLQLHAVAGKDESIAYFSALQARLRGKTMREGTSLDIRDDSAAGQGMQLSVKGRAAHAGVNATGGRNAIVALAEAAAGELPQGGARDLLEFAKLAGQDLQGTGLGLTEADPVFGRAIAVPSVLRAEANGKVRLTINIRSNPNLSGEALQKHLFEQVASFNTRTGASLEPGGFFGDKPLAFDPKAKIVKRLLTAYRHATGHTEAPAISGGGTYAKSLPNAIAFGMWFTDKPYPGHDVDEQVSVADLHKGARVLLAALADIACSKPMKEPFKP